MTATDFAEWEGHQPLAFGLVDGVPVRLPEADQAPSRLARARHVAGRVLESEEAVETWMTGEQLLLGGQRVLRLLVVLGRVKEGADV